MATSKPQSPFSRSFHFCLLALAMSVCTSSASADSKETVLYNFAAAGNGSAYNPVGSPIFDSSGNLYLTAPVGDYGPQVLQMIPPASEGGTWTINFISGWEVLPGPLIFDAGGNLFFTINSQDYTAIEKLIHPLKPGGLWKVVTIWSSGTSTPGRG